MDSKTWGGKRPGAGRRKQNVKLTPFVAELVELFIKRNELLDSPETVDVVVNDILRQHLTILHNHHIALENRQLSDEVTLINMLTPQPEPVATIYRRLAWSRSRLEQTITTHRAALAQAGLRMHVATKDAASGRQERYITIDGTRYSHISRPLAPTTT